MECAKEKQTLTQCGPPESSVPVAPLSPAALLSTGFADLISRSRAFRFLLGRLYPAGPVCPHCRVPVRAEAHAAFWAGKRLRCHACATWYKATTNTPLAGAKISARAVAIIAVCLALGADTATTARLASVSCETVRWWSRRLEEPAS